MAQAHCPRLTANGSSLQALAGAALGLQLDKALQRSSWGAEQLTDAQVGQAAGLHWGPQPPPLPQGAAAAASPILQDVLSAAAFSMLLHGVASRSAVSGEWQPLLRGGLGSKLCVWAACMAACLLQVSCVAASDAVSRRQVRSRVTYLTHVLLRTCRSATLQQTPG